MSQAPPGFIDITISGDTTGFVTGVPPDDLPNDATGDLDADVQFPTGDGTLISGTWEIITGPTLGVVSIDAGTGEWLYEVDPAEFDSLDNGEFVEDTFEVQFEVIALFPGFQFLTETETQTITIGIEGICFAGGTLIATDRGEVPVEDLARGDLVVTQDNGLQPIRWIDSSRLSLARLMAAPNLWPVKIEKGALGPDRPCRDLVVTQQHRLLVSGPQVEILFGVEEALVPAKSLCHWDGISICTPVADIEYFHILFDRHEILSADGAPAESLFLGEEALIAMTSEGRQELARIFEEAALSEAHAFGTSARRILKYAEASALS